MNDKDVETTVQKFCDTHRDIITFAIEFGIIRLGNRMLGHDGNKHLENGLRDLIPTIDNSQLPAGYEALQKIIKGVTLVTFGAAYAEATKIAVINKRNSDVAKLPRSRDCGPIIEFIKEQLKRNQDISNHEILTALDSEAEHATQDGRIEFSNDQAGFVSLGEDGKTRFHLARKSVPKTISRLKKKLFGH